MGTIYEFGWPTILLDIHFSAKYYALIVAECDGIGPQPNVNSLLAPSAFPSATARDLFNLNTGPPPLTNFTNGSFLNGAAATMTGGTPLVKQQSNAACWSLVVLTAGGANLFSPIPNVGCYPGFFDQKTAAASGAMFNSMDAYTWDPAAVYNFPGNILTGPFFNGSFWELDILPYVWAADMMPKLYKLNGFQITAINSLSAPGSDSNPNLTPTFAQLEAAKNKMYSFFDPNGTPTQINLGHGAAPVPDTANTFSPNSLTTAGWTSTSTAWLLPANRSSKYTVTVKGNKSGRLYGPSGSIPISTTATATAYVFKRGKQPKTLFKPLPAFEQPGVLQAPNITGFIHEAVKDLSSDGTATFTFDSNGFPTVT